MKWRVVLTPTALEMLKKIRDRRVLEGIRDKIDTLANDPEKQGKPLGGQLTGLRSVRAVGQRYRIIYKIERNKIIVYVIAIGLRKEGDRADIYELAKKLLKFKLVEGSK